MNVSRSRNTVIKKTKYNLSVLILVLILGSCQKRTLTSDPATRYFSEVYNDVEFEIPVVNEPEFQDFEASIIDFGAVGDGTTLNTDAINHTIDHVSGKGGGKVVIPRGIWLTGPIHLKNDINLHLEEGALLLFSRNLDDYPLVKTSFEGLETYRCSSPISGYNLENIAITGKGIIDGSGDSWRPVKKYKLTEIQWNDLILSGGVLNESKTTWYPTKESMSGAQITSNFNVPDSMVTEKDYEQVKDFLRPVMVSLVECSNVMLDGPTFQNSPSWNLHPLMCDHLTLKNLTVKNPWYSQNGDGVDLESSRNVVIYNCNFDVGDDAICIKSGKNEDGRKRGIPTENVIVKSCIVYHAHGGFVIGSEMSGGVKNMHVSNCTFIGTDVGLRFKSTRGRGGVVENIYISNINMIDIPTEAIRFNLYYEGGSPIPEPDDTLRSQPGAPSYEQINEGTPEFRNIHVKNTRCIGAETAIKMVGLPEMKLNNFTFENIYIKSKHGINIVDSKNIDFINVTVDCVQKPVINIERSTQITFDNFSYTETDSVLVIKDSESEGIKFIKTNFTDTAKQVISAAGEEKQVISIQ